MVLLFVVVVGDGRGVDGGWSWWWVLLLVLDFGVVIAVVGLRLPLLPAC